MKSRHWMLGGVAAAAILAAGLAVAQSGGSGGGQGMHGQYGRGMHQEAGSGREGQQHGSRGRQAEGRGQSEHGHQGWRRESRGSAGDHRGGHDADEKEHGRMGGMRHGRGGENHEEAGSRGSHGHMGSSGSEAAGQTGPAGRGARSQSGSQGAGRLPFFDTAQIDRLKSDIAVTPAQESAWTKYATTLKDVATSLKSRRDNMDRDAVHKMSPADRTAFVNAQREDARSQFATVTAAGNELLAVLTDEQKSKARASLPGLASRGPGAQAGMMQSHRQH